MNIPVRRKRLSGLLEIISTVNGNHVNIAGRQSRLSGVARATCPD
ncbi:hypothetical protein ACTQ1O_12335 [Bilifractor sp. LCP21S3_A7]